MAVGTLVPQIHHSRCTCPPEYRNTRQPEGGWAAHQNSAKGESGDTTAEPQAIRYLRRAAQQQCGSWAGR